MSRFGLLYDVKNALRRAVDFDDLLVAIFSDHPDLQTLRYEVTNEYDDSNYSDYVRLSAVNGWAVDYDGEYDKDQFADADEDESEQPKASQDAVNESMKLCDFVKDKYGYGSWEFSRDDYRSESDRVSGAANMECAFAALSGKKLPASVILEADNIWIGHYSDVHGRYSPEDEFTLLAREDMMGMALEYAQKHGPLSENTLNYFVLSLKSDDHGYDKLQEYLEWLKGKVA